MARLFDLSADGVRVPRPGKKPSTIPPAGWYPTPKWVLGLSHHDGSYSKREIVGDYNKAVAEREEARRTGKYWRIWMEMVR